ncbi:hypothetical protein L484_015592 [Morus notabilis]|uniref:Uncharacterized protein n=1 Tax=Morus notabilis TaxID=981085 RepID=W9S313_9ROSA|nr:hypothetical protein L484_015592 [Morus notabilis]
MKEERLEPSRAEPNRAMMASPRHAGSSHALKGRHARNEEALSPTFPAGNHIKDALLALLSDGSEQLIIYSWPHPSLPTLS